MVASAKESPNLPSAPSRREMLNYAFGASIALALAGSCGGLVWFTQRQRIGYGEKSGLFLIDLSSFPKPGDAPISVDGAYTWLSNIGDGLLALSSTCPFRFGCILKWSYSNNRFECPCCGSKFQLDGTYIEGPAKRGMDKFIIRVGTQYDTHVTPADGSPVSVDGATSVVVDTDASTLIPGKLRQPRQT